MRQFREISRNWEFRENFAKINEFIYAKFKIFSSKFRVSRNFKNAVSQPPYLSSVECCCTIFCIFGMSPHTISLKNSSLTSPLHSDSFSSYPSLLIAHFCYLIRIPNFSSHIYHSSSRILYPSFLITFPHPLYLIPPPSTLSPQLNRPPSIFNLQPSIFNLQPSTL